MTHRSTIKYVAFAALLSATALSAPFAYANPQGGTVSAGNAIIPPANGSLQEINQSSDKAVIDWRSFNIDKGETTRFNQPSASSLTLNRVNDLNPSKILGSLDANGRIILINPNGVFFGHDSQINVAGLVASTANISNDHFMAGLGSFDQPGNPNASIINEGTITAREAGLVGFVAPTVENRGTITATLGKIALQAGDQFTLDMAQDKLIQVGVSPELSHQLASNSGTLQADGGSVVLSAGLAGALVNSTVSNSGVVRADAFEQNESGGITLYAGVIDNTGTVQADGGAIAANAANISQQGVIQANGGAVNEQFSGAYIDNQASRTSAQDGSVTVAGGQSIFASGHYQASAGTVNMTAKDMKLYGTDIDVSSAHQGGTINLGGELHGGGSLAHADTVTVNPSTSLKADATDSGAGGQVVVWSDKSTAYGAKATARGGAQGGDGGLIEISSHGEDYVGGSTDASSPHGAAGTLLLDPHNITIGNSASGLQYFQIADPDIANNGGTFGNTVLTLPNGNIAVASLNDSFGTSHTGVVYLFNGATGALISALHGTNAEDQVGTSLTALTGSSNFVVTSPGWSSAKGAVTWIDGGTGLAANVSSGNSLVGSTAADAVGGGGVTALTNGNYVVASSAWNGNMGAVTWGDGGAGVAGAVSAANSLVGSSAGDKVGETITQLSNSNYTITSSHWSSDKGAVTWGDGTGSTLGAVSAANSLVGATGGDRVGSQGVTALTGNGNYVVSSPLWNGNLGAVTWGEGTNGTTVGVVSIANSLVGSNAGDKVGQNGAFSLSNGNYAAVSSLWNGNLGAVTWGDGAAGTVGAVDVTNSLIGSTSGDKVGSNTLLILTNGNYVVESPLWNSGRGAATFGCGAAGNACAANGVHGTIDITNSLVGSSAGDSVGNGYNNLTAGVPAKLAFPELTNGNYLVVSPLWNGGLGAVTWGDGATGTVGAVSSGNSLVGSSAGDHVGGGNEVNGLGNGGIVALSNGNYVVNSPSWNGFKGAATWGDGTTGITGTISAANSLVGATGGGSSTGDQVGIGGILALPNGNYVVDSFLWASGKGAATWGNGASGITGLISSANSLVGSLAGDYVGGGLVSALGNTGNYIVASLYWNDFRGMVAFGCGAAANACGTNGTSGVVSAANALVGSQSQDYVGSDDDFTFDGISETTFASGVTFFGNGDYSVAAPWWNGGQGAVLFASGTSGVAGTISKANALLGATGSSFFTTKPVRDDTTHQNHVVTDSGGSLYLVPFAGTSITYALMPTKDFTVSSAYLASVLSAGTNVALQANNDITLANDLTVTGGGGGDLLLQAGRSILLNANITTGNGDLTLRANAPAASGVVDANRDTGAAVITMATGTSINAGSGNVDIELMTGTGLTNHTAGDLTLRAITTTGDILAVNDNTTGDVVLNAVLSAHDITLASRRNFVNNFGSSVLQTTGRWLIYSTDPFDDVGALTSDLDIFSCTYNGACPAVPGTGNHDLYTYTPTLTLLIRPNPLSITYGDAVPAFTYTLSGYQGTDASSDIVTGSPTFTTNYTQGSVPGHYNITAAPNDLSSSIGYAFLGTTLTGGLTVGKAMLDITVNALAKTYGDANAFTFTYGGFIGSDGAGALSTLASVACAGCNGILTPVGTYTTTASGAVSTKYSFTYHDGSMTVARKAITIDPGTPTKTYGDGDPTFTSNLTYTGLVTGDSSSVFNGLITVDCVSCTGVLSAVGSYVLHPHGAASTANYSITYANGTLTVNPAVLIVILNTPSKIYSEPDPTFTLTYTGFVNGQDESVLTSPASFICSQCNGPLTPVGNYSIGATGAAASNYTIQYGDSFYSVLPATLTVAVDSHTKNFGAPDPLFTYHISGFVNGEDESALSSPVTIDCAECAGINTPVGTHVLTGDSGAPNYIFSFINGALTVLGSNAPPLAPNVVGLISSLVADRPFDTNNAVPDSQPGSSSALSSQLASMPGGAGNEMVQMSVNLMSQLTPASVSMESLVAAQLPMGAAIATSVVAPPVPAPAGAVSVSASTSLPREQANLATSQAAGASSQEQIPVAASTASSHSSAAASTVSQTTAKNTDAAVSAPYNSTQAASSEGAAPSIPTAQAQRQQAADTASDTQQAPVSQPLYPGSAETAAAPPSFLAEFLYQAFTHLIGSKPATLDMINLIKQLFAPSSSDDPETAARREALRLWFYNVFLPYLQALQNAPVTK